MSDGLKGLTERQEHFCQQYIDGGSATQAVIDSGYTDNRASAAVQAHRLLSTAKIVDRLDQIRDERNERIKVSQDEVLNKILEIAGADPALAFSEKDELLNIHDMPEEIRRCISSIEVDEIFAGFGKDREQVGYTKKIKFWSKDKMVELLARHVKIVSNVLEHKGDAKNPILVAAPTPEQMAEYIRVARGEK